MTEESKLECNGARGEVPLRIEDIDIVIAAEIGKLAAVSTALGCKSMTDLLLRLGGAEPSAVLAGLRFLTVRGDSDKAIEKLKLRHFNECAIAFDKALSHHFEEVSGNGAAAVKAA